jgi:choice-of-anchor B domain-containing protein
MARHRAVRLVFPFPCFLIDMLRSPFVVVWLVVGLIAGLLATDTQAQTTSTARPAASSAASSAGAGGFGHAIAVSGDVLFAGEAKSIHAPGRVLVYRWQDGGWSAPAELMANEANVGDGFGSALAVNGERLVVGAPASDAVYVFTPDGDTWTQSARLTLSDDLQADVAPAPDRRPYLGTTLAVSETTIAVRVTDPPFTFQPGTSSVVLFEQVDGAWTASQVLAPEDDATGDGFGTALAFHEGQLLVSAPNASGRSGALHVYARTAERQTDEARTEGDAWTRTQTLTGADGGFGRTVLAGNNQLWIGAPNAFDGRGAVQTAGRDGDVWTIQDTLLPFDAPRGGQFGSGIARTADGTLWVGAPGASRETGALYRITSADGAATRVERMVHPASAAGDRLGDAVVAAGSVVAASQPGDSYGAMMTGASSVAVYDAASGAWLDEPLTAPDRDVFASLSGERVPCAGGKAALFDCQDVDLLSFLPIDAISSTPGIRMNDVWGWTDPETGHDYVLAGRVDGVAFVDVTDPLRPVYVGELPKTPGTESKIWRDVKVYQNHAFVVADNVGEHGMQVFDLTQLRDVDGSDGPRTFEASARYDGIHSAHNVFINEDTGFAYVVASNGGGRTCGGGLHMVDIRDPMEPSFAGCFADPGTGMTGTGTTHDTQCVVYRGTDTRYQGQEICFSSNETAVSIADVTDKANPVGLATAEHPRSAYIHQGWLSEDQRYLYVNDELDEMTGITDRTRTLVWDVSELDDPQFVTEFFLSTPAADHNLYIDGTTMYQANYASGLRVVDISNPEAPREIGHFDTLPFGEDAPVFEGAFSNYPFFESGIVVVTSIQEGLFVLRKSETEM